METLIRRLDGQDLCPPCFDAALSPEQPVREAFVTECSPAELATPVSY